MSKKKVTQPQTKPTNPKKQNDTRPITDNQTPAEQNHNELINNINNNKKENDNMENNNLKNIVKNLTSALKQMDTDRIITTTNEIKNLSQEELKELVGLLNDKITQLKEKGKDDIAESLIDYIENIKSMLNNNKNNEEETYMYKNYKQCVVAENNELLERIYNEIFVGLYTDNANQLAEINNNKLYFNLDKIDEETKLFISIALRARLDDEDEYPEMNIYNWNEQKQDYIQDTNEQGAKLSHLPSVKGINYFDKFISKQAKEHFELIFIQQQVISADQYEVLNYGTALEYIIINLSAEQLTKMNEKFKSFRKDRLNEQRKNKIDAKAEAFGKTIVRSSKIAANVTSTVIEAGATAIVEGTKEFTNNFIIKRTQHREERELNNKTNYELQRAKQVAKQQVLSDIREAKQNAVLVGTIIKAIFTSEEQQSKSKIVD